MNKLFPIELHQRDDKFIATTALAKLAEDPDRITAQLRELADAYARALAETRAARADASQDRARAYWRIGEAIRGFENTLRAAGFYLPAQTATFAHDLELNEGTLRKIIAFHRKNPDPSGADARTIWHVRAGVNDE